MDFVSDLFRQMMEQRDRCLVAGPQYLPANPIEYLLIGESPPMSGSYFYIPEDIRRKGQSLPAKVFRSFLGVKGGVDEQRHEQCLIELQARNFFLVDLSTIPIDLFVHEYRKGVIVSEFEYFCSRYENLTLSTNVKQLLLLPAQTYAALEKSGGGFLEKLLNFIKIEESSICTWSNIEQKIRSNWR